MNYSRRRGGNRPESAYIGGGTGSYGRWWGGNGQATATPLVETSSAAGLFLLPGGLPRRLGEASDIQVGGLPRRGPRPAARRSRVRMACSSCSLSSFNSARILATSIMEPFQGRPDTGDRWPTSYEIHINYIQ